LPKAEKLFVHNFFPKKGLVDMAVVLRDHSQRWVRG